MSTIKAINVIHPSSTTNNIVTDDSGNVAVGGALTVGGVAAVAVTPGTSGNVLTSDGTDWTSAPVVAPVINSQTFDASGTWTKPSGYAAGSRVHIQAWGAGGSGGRHTTSSSNSGGGGGGYNERWITLSALSATETVTIGAGGASRTGSNQAGVIGGNSSFGAHITAYGGGGGSATSSTGGTGGGMLSAGGTNSNFPGQPIFGGDDSIGFQGVGGSPSFWHGGGGGTGLGGGFPLGGAQSVFGGGGGGGGASGGGGTSSFGGNGGAAGTTGVAGAVPGGGGGSGTSTSGAGGDGRVIITVFPA